MAVLTKNICATVSLKSSKRRKKEASLSLIPLFTTLCGRDSDNDVDFENLFGVSGVHFVLIPIEKVSDFKWNFYKPLPFVGQERADVLAPTNDILLQAKRWALRERTSGDKVSNRFGNPVGVSMSQEEFAVNHAGRLDQQSNHVVNVLEKPTDLIDNSAFILIDVSTSLPLFCKKQRDKARVLLQEAENTVERNAALMMLESAALKGDASALEDVKNLFMDGTKTTPEGMAMIAGVVEKGTADVGPNPLLAKQLYEMVIVEGTEIGAIKNLAHLLCNGAERVLADAPRAQSLYERAIREANDVEAMVSLGKLLETGAEGVAVDVSRAVELYERAIAEGNDIEATVSLGKFLETGAEGVAVDVSRVVELYERAIREGNNIEAMTNLGKILENGAKGVAVDVPRATELYERAVVEGNDTEAMVRLGKLLENGAEGVAVDVPRAVELYERAIREGNNIEAMTNLGLLLYIGAEGVPIDEGQAWLLFRRAIEEKTDAAATTKLSGKAMSKDNVKAISEVKIPEDFDEYKYVKQAKTNAEKAKRPFRQYLMDMAMEKKSDAGRTGQPSKKEHRMSASAGEVKVSRKRMGTYIESLENYAVRYAHSEREVGLLKHQVRLLEGVLSELRSRASPSSTHMPHVETGESGAQTETVSREAAA